MARKDSNASAERPVVVASNRLPFTFKHTAKGLVREPSAGGLVSALEPVLRKRGGTWVGWPGIDVWEGESIAARGEAYRIRPVALSETEVQRYYHGFSNRTLWPLMHSLAPQARFDARDFVHYEEVNKRFGAAAAEEGEDAGLVWIHDYQLLLAPAEVRKHLPDTRLAFFLHIPFPPYDIFRLLPWDRELLRGLLACDLIAFHVRSYAQNFLDCVERTLGARVDKAEMLVEYGDRSTRIRALPLGIEFERYEALARAAPPPQSARERVVLGIDRLDYTKGIPERMLAFERLLELHPEHREEVILLQIAVPSRSQVAEYRKLKRELDEIVGRINGRFATAGWSPIRYLYRTVDQQRLCGIYRDADVALVTPLRDGMNLVAKEFVACQVEAPGVLVLSRLAGAADTMREALMVNPYDIDGSAETLHRALTMEEEERASRATALRRRERRDDLGAWVTSFLEEAGVERPTLAPLQGADFSAWLDNFLKSYRLALFLDYDGTLSPLREHPSKARLPPRVRKALIACAERNDVDVSIVSGRSLADVQKMVGVPELTFAGNHGLEIDGGDIPHFSHEDLVHYRQRAEALASDLERCEVDGAWTEHKGPTLTYHYRAVPENRREQLVEDVR
ncbi:MAG: bifunctional alpha,alpha-trehalose-phosphate synthase (UDP-forming)/trehalose-phosphatase, partial [Myxococcota bacterium]|nr:bifunctional alpha,alpha-trehalose-phosphate synthase (UDP-forming)/trehalose-phosphatase [Myxococcota bacterium]